jgi:predicted O-methyltransferase YrrM
MQKLLGNIRNPRVLEIGVEHGLTTIPLLYFMGRTHQEFDYHCVDILFQERLKIMLANMPLGQDQRLMFFVQNSLYFLKENAIPKGMKYDLILIDGDHNYHTVSQELQLIEPLLDPNTVIIVDDYHGRWSEKDLWYAERDTHSDDGVQAIATKKQDSDKQGVKPAVDEFLQRHPDYRGVSPIQGEPIVLLPSAMVVAEAQQPSPAPDLSSGGVFGT